MHAQEGMSLSLPIVMTARHLAKRAPSLKYSSRRLRRPSSPSLTFSPGLSAMSCAPPSTLIPGMRPFALRYSAKGFPSFVFWRSVSSKRMTPLTNSAIPGVVKRSSRYARRFSSFDSTPTESKRFLQVPALSSAASSPLPGATIAFAVSAINFMSICAPFQFSICVHLRLSADTSFSRESLDVRREHRALVAHQLLVPVRGRSQSLDAGEAHALEQPFERLDAGREADAPHRGLRRMDFIRLVDDAEVPDHVPLESPRSPVDHA